MKAAGSTYARERAKAVHAAAIARRDAPQIIARETRHVPTLVFFRDRSKCDVEGGRVEVTIAAVGSRPKDAAAEKRLDDYINARLRKLREQGEAEA